MLSADEWDIVRLSLKVSCVAVGASLPVAFGLAWLLARGRFPGKILLDGLVHLPLVLPPVVTGWLLLIAFSNNGPAGRLLFDWFGITLMFRWTGAALAAAIMALPLMVRAMRLSIEAVDRRLEGAARDAGRDAMARLLDGHSAIEPARRAGRHGARLRALDRRVRRDDHLRLQHPRRDPHAPHRYLFGAPDSRP